MAVCVPQPLRRAASLDGSRTSPTAGRCSARRAGSVRRRSSGNVSRHERPRDCDGLPAQPASQRQIHESRSPVARKRAAPLVRARLSPAGDIPQLVNRDGSDAGQAETGRSAWRERPRRSRSVGVRSVDRSRVGASRGSGADAETCAGGSQREWGTPRSRPDAGAAFRARLGGRLRRDRPGGGGRSAVAAAARTARTHWSRHGATHAGGDRRQQCPPRRDLGARIGRRRRRPASFGPTRRRHCGYGGGPGAAPGPVGALPTEPRHAVGYLYRGRCAREGRAGP